MRLAFEIVFVLGVGSFCLGAFGVALAAMSWPLLGRSGRNDDRPFATVVRTEGGHTATAIGFWRMRRWAIRAVLIGAAIAVPVGAVMVAIWGE